MPAAETGKKDRPERWRRLISYATPLWRCGAAAGLVHAQRRRRRPRRRTAATRNKCRRDLLARRRARRLLAAHSCGRPVHLQRRNVASSGRRPRAPLAAQLGSQNYCMQSCHVNETLFLRPAPSRLAISLVNARRPNLAIYRFGERGRRGAAATAAARVTRATLFIEHARPLVVILWGRQLDWRHQCRRFPLAAGGVCSGRSPSKWRPD
jgi:hypothetical protein